MCFHIMKEETSKLITCLYLRLNEHVCCLLNLLFTNTLFQMLNEIMYFRKLLMIMH